MLILMLTETHGPHCDQLPHVLLPDGCLAKRSASPAHRLARLFTRCRLAEEYDKLALALGGRFCKRTVPLQCAGQGEERRRDGAAAAADAVGVAQERRRQR